MSQHIPEMCLQYLNVCTAQTVEIGYFQFGFVWGVISSIIIIFVITELRKKARRRER